MKGQIWIIAFTLLLGAEIATAGNRTFSGRISMDAPLADRTENNANSFADCDDQVNHVVVGTVQVSDSGGFRFADAGSNAFWVTEGNILDMMILVYEGVYDPADVEANLLGEYDFGQNFRTGDNFVQMEAGTDYVIVVQPWCISAAGVWGLVMDGPGDITGAGFDSDPDYLGTFAEADGTTSWENPFSGEMESYDYKVIGPVFVDKDGGYVHQDIAFMWQESPTRLWVYEGQFDPEDTARNLLPGVNGPSYQHSLLAGKRYFFVLTDVFGEGGQYQIVWYPPGDAGFNQYWTGAWYNPATAGQGALLQSSSELGFLFMALFTYDTADEAARTKAVGSPDQRWLTAYGTPGPNDRTVPLKYENATGGAFDQAVPEPSIDSDYGDGELEFIDCNHIRLTYNLPGGLEGEMNLQRALPGEERASCDGAIPPNPIEP